jgi:hypothetical protein
MHKIRCYVAMNETGDYAIGKSLEDAATDLLENEGAYAIFRVGRSVGPC